MVSGRENADRDVEVGVFDLKVVIVENVKEVMYNIILVVWIGRIGRIALRFRMTKFLLHIQQVLRFESL